MTHSHPLDEIDALLETPIGELAARFGSLDAAHDYIMARIDEGMRIENAREAAIAARARYQTELERYRARAF